MTALASGTSFRRIMADLAPDAARIARTFADRRGVAAVEFALIVPLLLLMYLGSLDVTRGVMASRKVDILSRTISDLVAQQTTVSATPSSTVALIFTTAAAIMAPYTTTGLKLTVSAVDIKANSNGTCCQALVRWSYAQGGSLRACTTPLIQAADGTPPAPTNIPASIINANKNAGYGYTTGQSSYLIIADVSYTYVPFFQRAVAWFSAGMTKTTYMVPRSASGPITLASPVNAAVGQSGAICF